MINNSKKPIAMELETIVEYLKKNLQYKEIYHKILYQQIINRKAEEINLTVTPEEIQSEADNHRREKKLEKASDTYAWLENEMITADDWELGIQEKLLRQKLKKHLFAKETEKAFAQNKLNFDQVVLYQIIVPYKKLAWEIFYQIEEEELSFYQAAHLYDIDDKRRYHCGYEGTIPRWSITPEFASRIFAAKALEVILPFQTEQGYHILMVEEFIPAKLTPKIYEEILEKMFTEWLKSELNYLLHNNSGEQALVNEPENASPPDKSI